ncbi:hypothetical protein V6Z12_D11G301600 [Gossypium hirsutum]
MEVESIELAMDRQRKQAPGSQATDTILGFPDWLWSYMCCGHTSAPTSIPL